MTLYDITHFCNTHLSKICKTDVEHKKEARFFCGSSKTAKGNQPKGLYTIYSCYCFIYRCIFTAFTCDDHLFSKLASLNTDITIALCSYLRAE